MTDMDSSQTLLSVTNLNLSFAGNRVLTDVCFNVRTQTVASVIGPNGAGKTSLFNSITGFYKPQNGRIDFLGHALLGRKPHQVTAAGIARTFQNVRLFKQMSVIENVMAGMHCRTRSGLFDAVLGTPRHRQEEREIEDMARRCLKFVGLAEKAVLTAQNLPYGHQRLVELARAMASQPHLILLDEPAAGLTSAEKNRLMDLVRHLRDDWDIAVLLIEHDMGLVMQVSDIITVLDHGKVLAEGDSPTIRNNPQVIEAYLGPEETDLDTL